MAATGQAAANKRWHDFLRFDNKPITSPYILSDLGLTSLGVNKRAYSPAG